MLNSVPTQRGAALTRYYFDIRDNTGLYPDEEGLDLPSIDAARQEAAHALADMLRDAVRDGAGRPRPRSRNHG